MNNTLTSCRYWRNDNISYALLFRIASGQMFGPNQPVALNLIEIEHGMDALPRNCYGAR